MFEVLGRKDVYGISGISKTIPRQTSVEGAIVERFIKVPRQQGFDVIPPKTVDFVGQFESLQRLMRTPER